MSEEEIKDETEAKKTKLSWEDVEGYLQEEDYGGAAMALIETDKILNQVLLRLGYPGNNIDQRLIAAGKKIRNQQELEVSRSILKRIMEDVGEKLKPKETREVMTAYWQAIKYLTEDHGRPINRLGKIQGWGRILVSRPEPTNWSRLGKKAAVGVFLFFLGVYILDVTETGRLAASLAVRASHFVFSWVLFSILLIGGVLIIVFLSLFYFESRRKKKVIKVETQPPTSDNQVQEVRRRKFFRRGR